MPSMKFTDADPSSRFLETLAFPYGTPDQSTAKGRMYKSAYSTTDYERFARRYPFGGMYVRNVARDCWEKLFRLQQSGKDLSVESQKLTKHIKEVAQSTLMFGHTLERLDGASVTLLGHSDVKKDSDPDVWESEPGEDTKVAWTFFFRQNNYNIDFTRGGQLIVPKRPQELELNLDSQTVKVHPDRYIYMVNPDYMDVLDTSTEGISVLEMVADTLEMKHYSDWAIGQALWRAAVGYLQLQAPRKLDDDEMQLVLHHYNSSINAKMVNILPPNWEAKVLNLAASLDVSKYYGPLLDNLSMASRIPKSHLTGSDRGALKARLEDQVDYYNMINSIQNIECTPWVMEYIKKMRNSVPEVANLQGDYDIIWKPVRKLTQEQQMLYDTLSITLSSLIRVLKKCETEHRLLTDEEGKHISHLNATIKETSRALNADWRPEK